MNYPLYWSEKKKVLKICKDKSITSIEYDNISTEKGYMFNFECDYKTNQEDVMMDAIQVFKNILVYAENNPQSLLHNQYLMLRVKLAHDCGPMEFDLSNYDDETDYFEPNKCVKARITNSNVSLTSLADISYEINILKLVSYNNFNIDDLSIFTNLKTLNIYNIYYPDSYDKLSESDISEIANRYDELNIIV